MHRVRIGIVCIVEFQIICSRLKSDLNAVVRCGSCGINVSKTTAGFRETLNYNSTLEGRFNSTGEVTFYVLNQTEYLSQNSSGSLAYIYTTGTTTNHSVQVALQSGTYYLEFYNTNNSNPDTVHLTEPFTISFST